MHGARRLLVAMRLASIEIKLDLLARSLERRYRPDQPRAPRGTPIGGQWIDDAAAGNSRRRIAQITEFGILLVQVRLNDGARACVYDLGTQKWIVYFTQTRELGCYGLLHQSSIFRLGTRLNDWR